MFSMLGWILFGLDDSLSEAFCVFGLMESSSSRLTISAKVRGVVVPLLSRIERSEYQAK